ncbi:MAG TPA: methylmalonyl-CoA mutase subunit beta [Jatrophihabitans sp.]|nr:methylmalonyl-CoA mutase subunit beta [Jatrophihabitans sp.]
MSEQPDQPLSLAADFPPASRQRWRELVAGVLAKSGIRYDEAEPETALAHEGYDGFPVAPLYTADDLPELPAAEPGRPPYLRGDQPRPGWDVRARHDDADPVAASRAILADLAGGASSLWLKLGPDGIPAGRLAEALAGVYLELVPVVLDAGTDCLDAARTFLQLAAELAPAEVRGSLGADPVGAAARTGAAPDLTPLAELWRLTDGYPNLLPITVDGTVYHDAGGSDGDELAVTAAVGLAYLRAAEAAGVPLTTAFAGLEFRYAVTADQFGSIAKLRAARRIWDRIGELSGIEQRAGQRQHAVTSAAMLTRRDPWVNLLRTTIGCFAAAIGGAAAITVTPFDAALGQPDEFGRRLARNIQAILHDEASLARVTDAAGGSYYVEALTDRLAEAAWHKFTELERTGGAPAALESGALAELLERSWQARRRNLAHRSDPITGVSEFPLLAEEPVRRPARPALTGKGLPVHRYAEDYEQLRDRADELAEAGARPAIFLAALGPAAVHTPRLNFASNLAQAGGVEPVVGTGEPAGLAAAFAASGARIACLCSSDKVYAEQAAEAAAALKGAGARAVWIAGKPELVGGDIDRAVFTGCDALERLRWIFEEAEA